MLTIFNRRELLTTCSMEEQNRVRDILAKNHIDYRIKTVNPSARTTFASSGRSRTGSFGVDMDCAYQYYIYVHKNDYARAQSLI
ncbi:MAG: hypothetical protein IKB79_00820 [Oscillospiraceae bacterium]|nr:hypothetical protein [Oscillospiraceae bacterium]